MSRKIGFTSFKALLCVLFAFLSLIKAQNARAPGENAISIRDEVFKLTPKWLHEPVTAKSLESQFDGAVVYSEDTVYYTLDNIRLVFAVSPRTNKTEWLLDQSTGLPFFENPSSYQGSYLSGSKPRKPIQMQSLQGVLIVYDPDLNVLTGVNTRDNSNPKFLFTHKLKKGMLALATRDTNKQVFVYTNNTNEQFNKSGVYSLDSQEGFVRWQFVGNLTGIKGANKFEVPLRCRTADVDELTLEQDQIAKRLTQICGKDDTPCEREQDGLKKRKEEISRQLNILFTLGKTTKKARRKFYKECRDTKKKNKLKRQKLEKQGLLNHATLVGNKFACDVGCGYVEFMSKWGTLYANIDNAVYFLNDRGEMIGRFLPKDVEGKCEPHFGRLWYSSGTYIFCFGEDRVYYLEPRNGYELKMSRANFKPITQEVIAYDDRLYWIENGRAVGREIKSGEKQWDFQCDTVQSNAALGECQALYICADPALKYLAVGCGWCGGASANDRGYTVIVDREDGKTIYGVYDNEDIYNSSSRCYMQGNPFQQNSAKGFDTVYIRQGMREPNATWADDVPTGGNKLYAFTITNQTQQVNTAQSASFLRPQGSSSGQRSRKAPEQFTPKQAEKQFDQFSSGDGGAVVNLGGGAEKKFQMVGGVVAVVMGVVAMVVV